MGIAKSAGSASAPANVVATSTPDAVSRTEVQAHPEVYRFFNSQKDGGDTHIHEISKWAFSDSDNVGDALNKIRKLELKLGAPSIGETRISKISNWIRIDNSINGKRKEMDDELKAAKARSQESEKNIKSNYSAKISALKAQLSEVNAKYKNAVRAFKLNANNTARSIMEKHGKEIKDLEGMLSVYSGGR